MRTLENMWRAVPRSSSRGASWIDPAGTHRAERRQRELVLSQRSASGIFRPCGEPPECRIPAESASESPDSLPNNRLQPTDGWPMIAGG